MEIGTVVEVIGRVELCNEDGPLELDTVFVIVVLGITEEMVEFVTIEELPNDDDNKVEVLSNDDDNDTLEAETEDKLDSIDFELVAADDVTLEYCALAPAAKANKDKM